jgi:ubiquinone/menaquinone biosynthesis C-methylase UbiE
MIFDTKTKFLDPEKVLFASGLSAGQSFADIGAGSGFYSVAAAKITGEQGMVYSVDILGPTLDHIAAESRLKGIRNIKTLQCDLEQKNACHIISTGSMDMVLFANIAHQVKKSANLFAEAYRLLKTGGKLVVVEWSDQPGPIGPPADQRISAVRITKLSADAAFRSAGNITTDIYHYGLVFIK